MRLYLLTLPPLALLPLALSGCVVANVAQTAVAVATLPVKAVSKGVDLATTSQAEADQKRGRELRRIEEEVGKRQRQWAAQCHTAQSRGEACLPAPEPEPAAKPPR